MLIAFGSPENVLPYAKEYVSITAIGFPFLIITTGGGHLIRADGILVISYLSNCKTVRIKKEHLIPNPHYLKRITSPGAASGIAQGSQPIESFNYIFLFFTILNFMQPITSTFFTSIGKAYKGIFLSLTRQILFLLPVMIVLPLFIGINGILYSGLIADFLAFIVTLIMISKELRNISKLER